MFFCSRPPVQHSLVSFPLSAFFLWFAITLQSLSPPHVSSTYNKTIYLAVCVCRARCHNMVIPTSHLLLPTSHELTHSTLHSQTVASNGAPRPRSSTHGHSLHDAWSDIPAFVDLLVTLSIEQALSRSSSPSTHSPQAVSVSSPSSTVVSTDTITSEYSITPSPNTHTSHTIPNGCPLD